jgi:hypothetical protein
VKSQPGTPERYLARRGRVLHGGRRFDFGFELRRTMTDINPRSVNGGTAPAATL